MLNLGIVQNPMIGTAAPPDCAGVLPGYGPARIIINAAFSSGLHAWGALANGVPWTLLLAVAVVWVRSRLIAVSDDRPR